jgi:hypothetical protein
MPRWPELKWTPFFSSGSAGDAGTLSLKAGVDAAFQGRFFHVSPSMIFWIVVGYTSNFRASARNPDPVMPRL